MTNRGGRTRIALLCLVVTACSSNRYLHGRGGPEYDVTIVNNCSVYTARLYLDDEYRNRRKIDVRWHGIGTKPRTMRLPAGPHTYHAEFHELENIKVREGSFVVRGPSTFRMC